MAAFTEKVLASAGKLLWIDYFDYASRLLAGGSAPWLDTAGCTAWLRKTQGLLGSDVVGLPVGAISTAWLAAHPVLREAMRAKSRNIFPLRTLLGDEALRAHLVALVHAVKGSLPGCLLALACPSPRAWVAEAYALAHGSEVEVGADEADSVAPYFADFLRNFGDAGVEALLLVETATTEVASAAELECYRSVLNVAAHYRWDAGLFAPGTRYAGGDAGFTFTIAPRVLPGSLSGTIITEDFWSGSSAPEASPDGFRFITVPDGAEPELVLERRALLR